jgi:hypothetical protein
MPPSTETVCSYPYTWPSNINFTTDATLCTITYAQGLGVQHDIYQSVLVIISLISCLSMTRKLILLKSASHRLKIPFTSMPSFQYFLAAFFFTFFFTLESFDVYGFRGWYPAELYYILDELVASSFISMGIVLVDFWVRISRGMGLNRFGLPPREKNFFLLALVINFPIWEIVGICLPEMYGIFEGIKGLGGFIILLFFCFRSFYAIRELHHTLKQSGNSGNNNHLIINQAVLHNSQRAIKVLIRKYAQFMGLVIAGMLALLAAGILAFVGDDIYPSTPYKWINTYASQYDGLQIGIRVVYICGAICTSFFFNIPKNELEHKPSTRGENITSNSQNNGILSKFKSAFGLNSIMVVSNSLPKSVHNSDGNFTSHQQTIVADSVVRESGIFKHITIK